MLAKNLIDSSSKLFCFFKVYKSKPSNFGGLTVPNKSFIAYVKQIEDIIIRTFTDALCSNGVMKSFMQQIPIFKLAQCSHFPTKYAKKTIHQTMDLLHSKIWKFSTFSWQTNEKAESTSKYSTGTNIMVIISMYVKLYGFVNVQQLKGQQISCTNISICPAR